MKIRDFKKEDSKQCISIMMDNQKNMGDLYDEKSIVDASSYTTFRVMEENDKIVGFIGFTDLKNGIGMIGSLCVSKKAQGKGVGRKLLQDIKVLGVKEKYRKLLLLTHIENKPMMILAIKEDFIPEGSLKNHFRDGRDVTYFSFFI